MLLLSCFLMPIFCLLVFKLYAGVWKMTRWVDEEVFLKILSSRKCNVPLRCGVQTSQSERVGNVEDTHDECGTSEKVGE